MFKLLCLSAFVAAANAVICRPDTKSCGTVLCAAVTADNCNELYGGYCICCAACITELDEGETCVSTLLLGIPSTSQCANGLYCHPTTHICTAMPVKRTTGPCAEALAKVDARYQAEPLLVGLERPHCDTDGTYLGMQYSGSQAYCVTKDGTLIDGYMVNRWDAGDDMNCQCARDQYDYMQTGLIGKMFHCEKNGNYASIGCLGVVCYCQDKFGKQVGTSTVPIGQQDSLNC